MFNFVLEKVLHGYALLTFNSSDDLQVGKIVKQQLEAKSHENPLTLFQIVRSFLRRFHH
jgi:hypothetical protein